MDRTKPTELVVGQRVQVPAHTEAWVNGDKYGQIVEVAAQAISIGMVDNYGPQRGPPEPGGIRAPMFWGGRG